MRAVRYSDTEKRVYWIGVGIALRHRNATKEFGEKLDKVYYNSLRAGIAWGLKNVPKIERRAIRRS